MLTLGYWRERRFRARRPGDVFPIFTLVCGAAFVINLASQALVENAATVTILAVALQIVTGLVPALLLHLTLVESGRSGRRWLVMFYVASELLATAKAVNDAGWVALGAENLLGRAPAACMLAACTLGLVSIAKSRGDDRYPRWLTAILPVMLTASAVNLFDPGPVVTVLPDYLLLLFFGVTLYYKERLVFFDLLIKRGAFFVVAVTTLAIFFVVVAPLLEQSAARNWILALALSPLLLAAPAIYDRLSRFIDRVWLGRRYSAADAERQFLTDIQAAESETELRRCATQSLGQIFQTPVPEDLDLSPKGIADALVRRGAWLLSDDRRLLETLSRTLVVVLENVRVRQQRQELRLLASRAELKALRAQINPHFLFNALNAIAGLIEQQPKLADEAVEHLAHVFRYTLHKSEQEWVRLEEEIEFVGAYLRVEQARFGDRLRVALHVDSAAAAILIPAMSLQPLVENAVRHGASTIEAGGEVVLRASVEHDELHVDVIDNGPGFSPEFELDSLNGHAHGLRNVIARLRGYYGEAAGVSWKCVDGQTRVRLTLPIPNVRA